MWSNEDNGVLLANNNQNQLMIPLHHFRQIDVPADDNCFFHAVVHQLHMKGWKVNHQMLRRFTVELIRGNQNDLNDFMVEETITEYLTRMYRSGQWVDNIMVNNLSALLEVNIVLYQNDGVIYYNLSMNSYYATIYLLHVAEMHYKSLQIIEYEYTRNHMEMM